MTTLLITQQRLIKFLVQKSSLIRQKKRLGSAYRDGFKWGLENNFDYLLEMDADFSHRINDLKKLISEK